MRKLNFDHLDFNRSTLPSYSYQLDITRGNVIYVACPGYHATGGTELMHQLAHHLRSFGLSAFMYYLEGRKWQRGIDPVHPELKSYDNPWVDSIADDPHNVVIVPENNTNILSRFHQVQKVIWWLSVDNYISTIPNTGILKAIARHALWFSGIRSRPFLFWTDIRKPIFHFYQSEYARKFIIAKGIDTKRIFPLGDYLNPSFIKQDLSPEAHRKNVVLYNPRKGLEFTRKLICTAPDIEFVALEDLTREQIIELLRSAKLYIDFGNHPGKDRIPREACISGACILTGLRGSAANDLDVPISSDYKFSETEEAIPPIIDKIKNILNNFPDETKHFESYRAKIRKEPDEFLTQLKNIFLTAH